MSRQALFAPITDQGTLKDSAVERLTEKILMGEIAPGQRLNESELARQFRTSRAPVREAMHQLLEQGLVMNKRRRGMFVVKLNEQDVQKMNSLRMVLESEALRLARDLKTPSAIEKLNSIVRKMEEQEPVGANPAQSARIDIEFHHTLWSLTGNEYLVRILTSLTAPLFARATLMHFQAKMHLANNSHRPLLQFVSGCSNQSAEEVMLAHLSQQLPDR